jgi:metallo-beta-lactamase family protein
MEITFLGAARTVTGSKFLLSAGDQRVLVDCGLFQGLKKLRQRNWRSLPVKPSEIDAVVLTHAHIDHSGYLPALVRDGFRGPIYCTPPSEDLVPILLTDSGRLQEEDAAYANRKGFSKHRPALPLYTEDDAKRVAKRLEAVGYHTDVDLGSWTCRFEPAGHILGAASLTITWDGTRFLFSGDLGRDDAPLIPPPESPLPADWIVMEGTYGNRDHPNADLEENLGEVARRTLGRGGVLMVPAFAVGRSQAILHAVYELIDGGELPEVPVYLNSPMAIDVTKLYVRHAAYHRLSIEECRQAFGRVRLVRSVDESKALNRRRGPFIVVAGAGMLSGGRILHHIRAFGGERRNTLLLTGYQAPGTRGAALLRGDDSLKIHGRQVQIRCEVEKLDGLSAHADRRGLLEWLEAMDGRPQGICLVHGEEPALESLAAAVTRSGIETRIPDYRETIELAG